MVFTLSHEMTHIYWESSSRARAPLQRERGQVCDAKQCQAKSHLHLDEVNE